MVSWFQKNLQKLMLLATAVMLSASVNVNAEVTGPVIPQGKGEQCVEPTDVMRKDHMEFMLHQRDETMHNGIRTKQHALKECINCHVQETHENDDGKVARYGEDEHFCSSCHNYAGVNIDCFQCHADRPQELIGKGHKIKPHHTADFKDKTIDKEALQALSKVSK